MLKNIIFDFGQVLVRFDPYYMTKAYIEDENDCLLSMDVIFDRLYWDRLDMGTITDDEVKEGICSRLPKRLHEKAIAVYDNWMFHLPFIDGMKELVYSLKKSGKKLFLLSNISIGFSEKYELVPEVNEVLSLFDGLVLSGPIGLIKPYKDIFNHLLTKYSLDANECIFIDDNEKNIEGSNNVGIEGYLFDGDAKKLKRYLEE